MIGVSYYMRGGGVNRTQLLIQNGWIWSNFLCPLDLIDEPNPYTKINTFYTDCDALTIYCKLVFLVLKKNICEFLYYVVTGALKNKKVKDMFRCWLWADNLRVMLHDT